MNFFRSEEHLQNWKGFKNKTGGIITLKDLMRLFSRPYFKNRRQEDYLSHMGAYLLNMIATLGTLENAGSYWRMKWFEKLGVTLGLKLGVI